MNNKTEKINWKQYGRVAVFIDVANVIYSLKKLGWRIDYKKLQEYFRKESKLADIYFYYSTKKENSGQANLLEMLARRGFQLRVKEVKTIKLKNGKIMLKGNCDVEFSLIKPAKITKPRVPKDNRVLDDFSTVSIAGWLFLSRAVNQFSNKTKYNF